MWRESSSRVLRSCRHEMGQNEVPITDFMIACQKPSIAMTVQAGTGNRANPRRAGLCGKTGRTRDRRVEGWGAQGAEAHPPQQGRLCAGQQACAHLLCRASGSRTTWPDATGREQEAEPHGLGRGGRKQGFIPAYTQRLRETGWGNGHEIKDSAGCNCGEALVAEVTGAASVASQRHEVERP